MARGEGGDDDPIEVCFWLLAPCARWVIAGVRRHAWAPRQRGWPGKCSIYTNLVQCRTDGDDVLARSTCYHQAQCFTATPPPKQIRGVDLKHGLLPYVPARPRWNLKVLRPCALHSHLGATWQHLGYSSQNASCFFNLRP
jgi:hypothetical protein